MLRIFNWFRSFFCVPRATNFLTSFAFRGVGEVKQIKNPKPKLDVIGNFVNFSVSSFAQELNGKKFVLANVWNDTIQINNGSNYLWKRAASDSLGGKVAAGYVWPCIDLLVAEGVIENNPFKPIEVVLVAYKDGFQLITTHEESNYTVLRCDERFSSFSIFDLETQIRETAKQKELSVVKDNILTGLKQKI